MPLVVNVAQGVLHCWGPTHNSSIVPAVALHSRVLRFVRAADFGVEEAVKIEGLGKADVSKQLEALVQRGEQMPRSTESVGAL